MTIHRTSVVRQGLKPLIIRYGNVAAEAATHKDDLCDGFIYEFLFHEQSLWVAASQVAEKLKFLSFRGTLRAEESLLLLTLEPREIPHFVRNDKIAYFFRRLFSRDNESPEKFGL